MASNEAIQAARRDPDPRLRLAFVCHCLRPEDGRAGRIGGAERAAAECLSRGADPARLTGSTASSDENTLGRSHW